MEIKEPKWGQIYKCQCNMDAIEWTDWDDEDPYIEICIWRNGSPNSSGPIRGFKEKCRWIWRILTNKNLYTDDIILDLGTLDLFLDGLNRWSEQKHKQLEKK